MTNSYNNKDRIERLHQGIEKLLEDIKNNNFSQSFPDEHMAYATKYLMLLGLPYQVYGNYITVSADYSGILDELKHALEFGCV
jgi:hypothetical protein